MESQKTHERIAITQDERESLHASLEASGIEIEEVEDTSVQPPMKVTMLPHDLYIQRRAKLARDREKAYMTQLRERRKQQKARANKARRRGRAKAA